MKNHFIPHFLFLILSVQTVQADANTFEQDASFFQHTKDWFFGKKVDKNNKIIDLDKFSQFALDTSQVQKLPTIRLSSSENFLTNRALDSFTEQRHFDFLEVIHQALQRYPKITQAIADVAKQEANIGVVKAQYYPQISGGLGTGDFTSSEWGRQMLSLSATQMVYDFGKIKSAVTIEQAKLMQNQAQVLLQIEDVAYQVANILVNIKRYQDLVNIADQQVTGIQRIADIAQLRAHAGVSSQVDPIQAQSNLDAAKATKVVQESQLRQYQQKLRTFLGYDIAMANWNIPTFLIQNVNLYQDPEWTQITQLMYAQMAVQIAQLQKQQTKLSIYPTVNIKGSLSQSIHGRNPNNYKEDGFYHSIMLEASSNFYQGGAVAAQIRAASYAEEAAKAQVNTVYLDVTDQVQLIREEIENKQKLIDILAKRRETARQTKELYQEQYKLGTRTIVDLLNAEQAIHSVAQDLESARYDIYSAIIKYIEITGYSRDLYQLNNISIQGFEIHP